MALRDHNQSEQSLDGARPMRVEHSVETKPSIVLSQGVVSGEYVVALPDGRIQTTRYEASPRLGYRARVSYQGPGTGQTLPHNDKKQK